MNLAEALKKIISYHINHNPQLRLADLQRQLPDVEPELIRKIYFDLRPEAAAAATLGKRGGETTTTAKSTAARANGKLGGRPRKQTT